MFSLRGDILFEGTEVEAKVGGLRWRLRLGLKCNCERYHQYEKD